MFLPATKVYFYNSRFTYIYTFLMHINCTVKCTLYFIIILLDFITVRISKLVTLQNGRVYIKQ